MQTDAGGKKRIIFIGYIGHDIQTSLLVKFSRVEVCRTKREGNMKKRLGLTSDRSPGGEGSELHVC